MSIGAFICGCGGPDLTAGETAFIREAQPWGLILFRRNVETPGQVARLTAGFRDLVGRADAPVLIDQEGGRVQRLGPPLAFWPPYPPARRYGDLYARDPVAGLAATRLVHRLIAADLHDIGINVDCVPVLDVPQPGSHDIVGDRAYAATPEPVALIARAAAAGLLAGGVLPVIKHIPGHGRALADSHHDLPVVTASLAELTACDFAPFAALADLPMAMTAHVVYTALDPEAPATLSAAVIGDVIRRRIGFDGLVMTDDLSMKALTGTMAERGAGALAAGCDMLLHCNGDLAEMEAVAEAAGRLAGPAAARAARATAWLRPPEPLDRAAAAAALAAVAPVAVA